MQDYRLEHNSSSLQIISLASQGIVMLDSFSIDPFLIGKNQSTNIVGSFDVRSCCSTDHPQGVILGPGKPEALANGECITTLSMARESRPTWQGEVDSDQIGEAANKIIHRLRG